VEGLISREGTELMGRLLQGNLEVRAAAETREAGVRGLMEYHEAMCEKGSKGLW
jgi:hypothetical protein